jgi:hypothetical protein
VNPNPATRPRAYQKSAPWNPLTDLTWFVPCIPIVSTALCEAILEAEGRPARDLPAIRKLLSEPSVFEAGE